MKKFLATFLNDDDGAITVDFVVLTAAICTLGLIVIGIFSDELIGLANEIEIAMSKMNAE